MTIRRAGKAWMSKLVAGAGGLCATALALGYSVYQQREAELVPLVETGTPIKAGRWTVTVTASAIATTTPNGGRLSAGKKAIALDMTLENMSAESSNLYGDLIKLANVPDASRPQYYLLRDRAILWDLQPRLGEAVEAVWEVPADLTLPENLELTVEGSFFKPKDNLYAAPGWFPSGSVAKVSVPLTTTPPETSP